jgi:hypothetical protein
MPKDTTKECNLENININVNNEKKEIIKKEITIFNSITKNYLSWIVILFAICIISYNNIFKGIFTFAFGIFLVYFMHLSSHLSLTVFSSLHHYHHNHNNFFSHFIQYVIELSIPILFLPFHSIFDLWIVMLTAIFYSSIHNINYGYFRVNDVHSSHHKDVFTNIGPDVCDVLFGTKNNNDTTVEITNHYIPNIIIITIIILIVKYACLNESIKHMLNNILYFFFSFTIIFYVISSIYVYCFIYKKNIFEFTSKINYNKLI